jgi:four helix bundle protein
MENMQKSINTHKDLEVWKEAIEFTTVMYTITGHFPKNEIYGLVSQIRRAAA